MNRSKPLTLNIPDPFDGLARTRLIRMGVLDKAGQLDHDTMRVFSGIFAGLFFDDLCEYYDDTGNLLTIFRTFRELYERQDYRRMILLLSLQYDYIRKPLPDPVWWLTGDDAAIREFMIIFMERLAFFFTEAVHIETGREDEQN